MDALIRLAQAWWPLYAVHFVEVSLFIFLVWAVDRWLKLDTRSRYVLYLLALAKVFVPPFYAVPIPEFLAIAPSANMPMSPVYTDVVSKDAVVPSAQVTPLPLAFYLFCLWGISVVGWAGVTLWKNAAFHRALRLAMPVDLAVESLNGVQDLKIYAKASLRSPLLVGIVKPRLYLPAHWSSWSAEELRGVVAHELAHRDNRDIWVLIFQAIAMALFCVNPLVWLLNRRLTFLRELRCDEAVLRQTNLTPAEYGRLLFGFVDRRPALGALYFNARGTALKRRLEYVLNFKENNVKRSQWQLAIPILIGLMIVPFSIREAYTQDEGGYEDEKKPTPAPEQEPPPAFAHVDSGEVDIHEGHEGARRQQTVSDDADSNAVLEFFMVDVKPKILHRVPPVYPETVRKERLQGKVFLKFMVNVDGSVSDVSVLRTLVYEIYPDSSRSEDLTRPKVSELFRLSAIQAVLQFRFKPAQHNGKIVPVWMTQPITFRVAPREVDSTKVEALKFVNFPHPIGKRDDVLAYDEVHEKPHLIGIGKPVLSEETEILKNMAGVGAMTVKFVVNVDSTASDVSVLKGPEEFHQPAINAILRGRFRPAKHNGEVVPAWMVMTFKILFEPEAAKYQSSPSMPVDEDSSAVETLEPVKSQHPIGSRDDVLAPDEVDEKPHPINIVTPVYPEEAKKKNITGAMTVKFVVNVDGSVSDVEVLKGPEELHQATIDAALQCRFRPAKHNGEVVPVWMVMPITFQLE